MAAARNKNQRTPITEETIVDMIKAWRLNQDTELSDLDVGKEKPNLTLAKPDISLPLKKDNVAPEEVVKIIKDYRAEQKIKYIQYQPPKDLTAGMRGVRKKLAESFQPHRTKSEALQVMGIEGEEKIKKWALKENNFLRLGRKIISLAEQNKIMLEYTTLNEGFTKRLKDENRDTAEKESGDKRPTQESPYALKMAGIMERREREQRERDAKRRKEDEDSEDEEKLRMLIEDAKDAQ